MKKLVALAIAVLLFFFAAKLILWSVHFMRETGVTPGLLVRLVFDQGAKLKSQDGRTNILILGIGGGTHAGADLTDTMMVLSSDAKSQTMAMISIPRDIWSDTLKDRINSAYHYGEEKQKGGGLLLAKVLVEDVIGQPVHYELVIDFSGFKNVIDGVGGVDVDVPRAFTDPDFPIAGKENDTCPGDPTNRCLYETIHFDAGLQHMDGLVALKYARSRHAEGEEGGDFARSRRQQDILVALKNKMIRPLTWTPTRLTNLPKVLDEASDMDMNIGEALTLGKQLVGIDVGKIKKISFEDKLEVPPSYVYGRYVLVPTEDWEDIHAFVANELH